MKRVRFLAIGAAVAALASTAAMAFDVQQGAKPSGQPAAQATPSESGNIDANMSLSESTAPAGGTEVRIPGLGRLGVLPKMDFGLELLYGATDPKQAEPQAPEANPADDLVVRGTVKHRF